MQHIIKNTLGYSKFKKHLLLLMVVIFFSGCGRLFQYNQTSMSFYFTTKSGTVYQYDGQVSQLTNTNTEDMALLNTHQLRLSNPSSFQILDGYGQVFLQHQSQQKMSAVAIDSALQNIYFSNSNGELLMTHLKTNTTTNLNIKTYPLPVQMIHDETAIYYHNRRQIIKITLKTGESSIITSNLSPIQTFEYHKKEQAIYYSSSTDGKIHKIDLLTKNKTLLHAPKSAHGTAIALSSDQNRLYFSKSNGQDTLINSIDLKNRQVVNHLRLFNQPFINRLAIKNYPTMKTN